jgi:hypothetical protein
VPRPDDHRRHQAEHEAGDECERGRESEHCRVQRGVGHPWNLTRAERDQAAHAGEPQREPARRAQRCEHHAFREQLPDQSPLTGTERGADRQFARTPGCAHQQQAGDVGAGNQQHHQHARLKYEQRRTGIAGQLLAQRHGVAAEPAR